MENTNASRVSRPAAGKSEADARLVPWWRRGFLASVFALASGTALAQLLLLACSPILTRLYGPGDFASYALYAAAVSLLAAFAAGRYEWALMLPKEDGQAASLLWLAVLLATGTSSLVALVIGCLALGWGQWLGQAVFWASWVPAGILAISMWGIVVKWQARQRRFALIARSEIGYALATLATQVLGGCLLQNGGGATLIAGHVVGRLVSVLILTLPLHSEFRGWRGQVAASSLWQQGRRYWRFPVFSSGASALGNGVGELPKLMLGIIASASTLGFYALAMRALRAPLFMVGEAVSGAFYPHISRMGDDRAASQRLLLRTCGVLAAIGIVPAAIVFLFGEPLFAMVFGEQWRAAGSVARMLVPLVLAEFAFSPIRSVLLSREKQHVFMIWQGCFLAGTAAAFAAGRLLPNVEQVVLIYSVMAAAMYFVLFGLAWRYVRQIPVQALSKSLAVDHALNSRPLAA